MIEKFFYRPRGSGGQQFNRCYSSCYAAGATVLSESRKGYGYACLRLDYLRKNDTPDIVVFLDGDYSDYPEELTQLVSLSHPTKLILLGSPVKEKENKAPTHSKFSEMALRVF